MQKRKRPEVTGITCYLCGMPDPQTRDHIPPKGIFEKPRPPDLITVPCCEGCRKGQHDDDEFFRAFICSLINRNPTAARLWKDKVVPRTMRRGGPIADMLKDLRKTATPVIIREKGRRKVAAMKFTTSQDSINRVLLRITRGLHSIERPGVNSSDFIFRVEQISPLSRVTLAWMDQLDARFPDHLTRGNEMFDCWWELSNSKPHIGRYVHMFARAAVWIVVFGEPPSDSA